MFTIQSQTHVDGIHGATIMNFMLNCDDAEYQAWWPGTHRAFHTIRRRPHNVGNRVYMDEFIGRRRLQLQGLVTTVVPGRQIVWQLQRRLPLPAWLALEVADDATGVRVTHTVRVGFRGLGRVLDPLWGLYFSPGFRRALAAHVQSEFPRLGARLTRQAPAGGGNQGEPAGVRSREVREPAPLAR